MRLLVLKLLVVAATIASASSVDTWWESAVVYQIYPRSFMDSNGDGIGDLNGITQKLPYLKETGIDAIWMSPIFLSPMYDFGYDITDYRKIAPEYGTMEDFDTLMNKAKELGIRVVLDYVPNHTSNESEWFIKSAQRDPKYVDYYIWANGRPDPKNPDNMAPPTNWISVFRKSAWEYSATRGQYYLHQFVVGQPDLNYRSEKVREEMKDVLRFWLDRGVSGFRVDAVNMLFEVDSNNFKGRYPDEPLSDEELLAEAICSFRNDSTTEIDILIPRGSKKCMCPHDGENAVADKTPLDYDYLSHIYTRDQNETYEVVYDWRAVLDEFTEKHNESKLMMTEAYTELPLMMRYYGNKTRNGSVPFNFAYLSLNNASNARDIKGTIDEWMTFMPAGKVPNWVNGNHDQSRLASRHGVHRVDAMNMLALLLPGITVTYQGEELGMTDGHVSWNDTKDPQACNTDDPINYWKSSRDPERTPYHWDASNNAGFSTANSTWLPVADNYESVNLASQMAANKSHYKFYKDVVALKRLPAVRSGDLHIRALCEYVLAVARVLPGHLTVVGVINLSDKEIAVDLSTIRILPQELQVEASGIACTLEKGVKVQKNNITMAAHCALALTSTEKFC